MGAEADEIFNLLIQVLELAGHLEDLDIHSLGDLLQRTPQITDVFPRLTSLHALSISGFSATHPSALSYFGSAPLRRLHLYFFYHYNVTGSLALFGDTF